ncbi:alpha/beta hydrolase [bacterium]|nr:alpha/beta hydrolase [bacterium]
MSALSLERIELWPGGAPGAKGANEWDKPWMSIHRPEAGKANGAAMLVCPGGGYNCVVINHEGLHVAKWLNDSGVTAFVLTYRVKPKGYTPDTAFTDATRAMRHIRANAKQYGIDPGRIGMMGFSAGGHLTTRVATHFDAGDPSSTDAVERVSSRPDFILPIYAAVNRPKDPSFSITNTVPLSSVPPAFFAHTSADQTVDPTGALTFFNALRKEGVDAEFHCFGGYGPHGVGLADGDPNMGAWPSLAVAWMRRSGFFTSAQRVAVSGSVTIDGRPVDHGWVTLTPIGYDTAPSASALISGSKPSFEIAAKYGPVPGPYAVSVRELCRGTQLEPSLERSILHTSDRPGGAALRFVVQPSNNVLDIAIKTKE